ncbi:MAG: hypothetical protein ACYSU4_08910 [Planctomycetota bacterium]|jgi:predicted RNase H-like nuclease (RuvC/YqgF family)
MNAIGQKVLEEMVIKMVLDFYKPFLDKGGHKKLAETIKAQIGLETEEFVTARKRAQRQLSKINETINNLLDNITSANREFVDKRLTELKQQKHQFKVRLEELDRLVVSQVEINNMVADAMQFISSLEFTLREGLAQEKLVILRRCIEKISINKPAVTVKLTVRSVPVGNLEGTKECQASL